MAACGRVGKRRRDILLHPSAQIERPGMNSETPSFSIVDDDHRVREGLSDLLSSVGLQVAAFGSAAEFLESEKSDAPACLVLDLQLRARAGWSFSGNWHLQGENGRQAQNHARAKSHK